MLKNLYEIDSIDFLDENFCFSKNRVVEICNRIIAEKLNIKWGTAARVDNVDKDLLKLMKEAGCIFILYGFETGSQQILNRMDKRISIERSWETFKITEEVGIDARGNLIIGHPGENTETLYESLEFQKRRHKFLIDKYSNCLADAEYQEEIEKRFSTVSFCTPYPGTRIYENYKEKIGDLEMFLKRITLHDAKELIINLTELPLVELLGYQSLLSNPSLWDYFQNTKS